MKLDLYISELLHQHDCVVLPDLGGFVANYKPAQVHPIRHTFDAPSKGISFNKNLIQNDGLLANYLVQHDNCSYQEACQRIENYVIKIQQELKQGKKVTLQDVGTLLLDPTNNILFTPENSLNFLLSSYGLSSFQKLPIQRASLEEKITKKFNDRTAPLIIEGEKKTNRRKWAIAAALIPLAFLSFWGVNETGLSGNLNFANFTPFTPAVKPVYTKLDTQFEEIEVKGSNFREQLTSVSEDKATIMVSFINGEDPIAVQLKEPIVATPVTTRVEDQTIPLKYHIVVGCFSEKVNAKKMVKTLKKRGLEAWLVGKRKNLWTVSYSSYATRKEAVNALALAKAENPKAWILNQ